MTKVNIKIKTTNIYLEDRGVHFTAPFQGSTGVLATDNPPYCFGGCT
jgi:hypothetical protein